MIFALAGNQNCGKTTLFNQLTGMNQHVGNFPGVTVDQKSGQVRGQKDCTVVDLPGIYSIRPYSAEEIVNAKALADAIGVYLRLQSKEVQAAFLGRYYFLDPVKEIASYLGMSESKVKTLLYRTRLGLKEYLEKEGFCL